MAKKKRTTRSAHPGVILVPRELPSGIRWQVRYTDPDTGKVKRPMLDKVMSTHEARRRWAIKKSRSLAKRRMELESGAPRIEGKPMADAIADYLADCEHRLRPKTLVTYTAAATRFRAWAEKEGVEGTHNLTGPKLAVFRQHAIALPRQTAKAGARRGRYKKTKAKRKPGAVNAELRAVRTMVLAWRLVGLTPLLDRDAVADSLKTLPTALDAPEHLTARQCQQLLQAALRHDAEQFALTRDEHDGRGQPGTTPRFDAVAPLVAFLLLSGCRVSEALNLEWERVNLRELDQDGNVVGEIRLVADDTKTKRARVIGLEVSPALRQLLAALDLRRGDAIYVFGGQDPAGYDKAQSARARLLAEYGAPAFNWQSLRQTTATFLTNAPSIFGAAAAFRSAAQLGHSVTVAEKRYAGLARGIARSARTLETAMQIESVLERVIEAAQPTRSARRSNSVARIGAGRVRA